MFWLVCCRYLEKCNEYLRLLVSSHLRRIETNSHFPISQFLSLFQEHTLKQVNIATSCCSCIHPLMKWITHSVHAYMHTYVHTCTRMYIHAYVCTYMHAYVHTCMYIYALVETYIHSYVHTDCAYMYVLRPHNLLALVCLYQHYSCTRGTTST